MKIHDGLGAITSSLTGNDAMSRAIAGVDASAIATNLNFFNTQNQHQYIDYAPKNFANNNPIFLLSPNFNTQSNYLTNIR